MKTLKIRNHQTINNVIDYFKLLTLFMNNLKKNLTLYQTKYQKKYHLFQHPIKSLGLINNYMKKLYR